MKKTDCVNIRVYDIKWDKKFILPTVETIIHISNKELNDNDLLIQDDVDDTYMIDSDKIDEYIFNQIEKTYGHKVEGFKTEYLDN